ncbi:MULTISPECIES: hypothetical protein [unclassified Methylobacterium]|jgi:hypothetical protein|uniref:hypothetical protein n=1 Tax=unclassified Methylobacterium TaxID=2615210 RepID=UPI0013545BEE|nr:hypothetical protein [Methylobacterium sp. 2A]MWV22029.1 hypothetical protein [Methylobacterium sp. 2A]
MRILFAVLAVFASVGTATAAETYTDYRDYFDTQPVVTPDSGRKSVRKTARPVDAIDTRRYDDGSASKNPDNLRPGYRGAAGIYVPPDYSTHPSELAGDGYAGWGGRSYRSYGAPNPFSGSLGTRR